MLRQQHTIALPVVGPMKSVLKWYRASLLAVAAMLLFPVAALGELGGTVSSVQADQQRLHGALRVSAAQAYALHEIRTASNGVVHEYVSADGKVFAVTYQGQFPGESNELLGAYGGQLAQAMHSAQRQRHVGGSVHIELPGLTYHAAGHMRYFSMRAFVPERVPQGVALEEIR